MPGMLKVIKRGHYIALVLNTETGEFEIWEIYKQKNECWDSGIHNKDEAAEVFNYAEKHYTDGGL